MARIQPAANIEAIRGKVGNNVFSKGRSVATLRKRVKPFNPQSSAQTQVRSFTKKFSQAWSGLTENQRIGWNNAALESLKSNVFGGKYHTTGHKLFVAFNVEAFLNGATVTITDPFTLTVNSTVQISALTASATGTPALSVTTDIAVPTNSVLIVEATAPLSAGVYNVKGKYRRIAILPSATVSGAQNILAAYTDKFGSLVAGKKVHVRAFTTNGDASKLVAKYKAQNDLSAIIA